MNRTIIIAEAGVNHNGDMGITKRLIDGAFSCQWDCVKFQKRNPDVCVPEHQGDMHLYILRLIFPP